MKIALDCRYYGNSGIGRINEGLLESLLEEKGLDHEWVLIGNAKKLAKFSSLGAILDEPSSPFSKKGLLLPKQTRKAINACDAFLSPGYIVPFGIKIPQYLFICDCVFFDLKDINNGFLDLKIKKYFYKKALKKAKKVFTISEFSKKRILELFHPKEEKVQVAYIGLSKSVTAFHGSFPKENRFIFVGNFKSHKGIDVLLSAFGQYKNKGGKFDLMLAGSKENLRTSFSFEGQAVKESDLLFLEHPTDEELLTAIASSSCLIQPSRYEGFGLPPLEAMCLGTNAILSDLDVFKEIYEGLPVDFFPCGDADALCQKMLDFVPKPLVGFQVPEKFSYRQMTLQILRVMEGKDR